VGVPFDTPNFFLLKVALTSFNVGKVGGLFMPGGERLKPIKVGPPGGPCLDSAL